MLTPLISIITPCYNSAKYIEETISSILKQTYTTWQLVIVNDCSKDNTAAIIETYTARDKRIHFIDLKINGGVANARNQGIKHATGDFIAFLDSDDLWDETKLEKQLRFMLENHFNLCHTAYRKIDSESKVITSAINVSKNVNYNQLLKHNEIGCLTAMFNVKEIQKRYFLKVGHEDFVFWLDILKDGYKSSGLNEVLASYRVHNNTVSSNKIKSATFTWNIYRNVEKLSFFKSAFYFICYSYNSFRKYAKRD
jgi:teichuronic acid biosynthesis glycosyltransferase TuaG